MANELVVREPDEARELVRLAFGELAGGVDGLHSVHASIAERVFTRTGPGGQPVHWMHDRIVGAVYGGLRGSVRGLGRAADGAMRLRPDWGGRIVSTTPRGAALVAAIDGLIGDTLESRQ